MPTHANNPNDPHRTHAASMTGAGEMTPDLGDWEEEESWWRENYAGRPYVSQERDFDYYRPGYRYGFESARLYRDRPWSEVEPHLRAGWDKYEYRGQTTWDELKDTVRDAWDHLTGAEHEQHHRRPER